MQPENKYPPLELHSVLSFGKHKGETLKEIIDTDLQYFCWMIRPDENMKGRFIVSGEVMGYYKEKVNEDSGFSRRSVERRFG
jgi:hypothetical protein